MNDLKRALKVKIEECSEMQIRRDLAEKKLQTVLDESKEKLSKIQNELEETKSIYKHKEKEFEDTLNHLQADIDSLEQEKSDLKEKLKLLSKRNLFEGITKTSIASNVEINATTAGAGYLQQLNSLQRTLDKSTEYNCKLKTQLTVIELRLKPQLKMPSHKPIWMTRGKKDADQSLNEKQNKWLSLMKNVQCLQKEVKSSIINEKMYNSKDSMRKHFHEENVNRRCLVVKFQKLKDEIIEFYRCYGRGLTIDSSLTQFRSSDIQVC